MKLQLWTIAIGIIAACTGCGGSGSSGFSGGESGTITGADSQTKAGEQFVEVALNGQHCSAAALTDNSAVLFTCVNTDGTTSPVQRWTLQGGLKALTPPTTSDGFTIAGFNSSGSFFGSYVDLNGPTVEGPIPSNAYYSDGKSLITLPARYASVVSVSEDGRYVIATLSSTDYSTAILEDGDELHLAAPSEGIELVASVVNNQGEVTGIARVGDRSHTFVDYYPYYQSSSKFELLPRPTNAQAAYGIDIRNDATISIRAEFSGDDSTKSVLPVYLFQHGKLTPSAVNDKGQVATVEDLNEHGVIAGGYFDDTQNIWKEFIRWPAGQMQDLNRLFPTLSGQLKALFINNKNEVLIEQRQLGIGDGIDPELATPEARYYLATLSPPTP